MEEIETMKKTKAEGENYHLLKEWSVDEKKVMETPPIKILALREWVKKELNAIPDNLYVYYVRTNAASPAFRSGDIIILDLGAKEIIDNAEYILVRDNGEPMARRLTRLISGKIRMSHESPNVPIEEISEDGREGVGIVGRIIWTAKRN